MSSSLLAAVPVVAAVLAGTFWALRDPGPVHACRCAQPGAPLEELEKFQAVFAGRVVSLRHSFDSGASRLGSGERTSVGFAVSEVWKGEVHEDIQVTTPPTGGSCGFAFVEGGDYIVYAHGSPHPEGGCAVGICSRTALLQGAREDLDALGEG